MKKLYLLLGSILFILSINIALGAGWGEPDTASCSNLDKGTYQTIYGSYGKDKNGIYYGCDKVDVKDTNTFEVVKDIVFTGSSYYAKDKFNVYRGKTTLTGIDINSFEAIPGDWIVKDKNHIINPNSIIDGVDGKNLKVYGGYASDGKSIFICTDLGYSKLEGVDILTWKTVQYGTGWWNTRYSKDKNNVYLRDYVFSGADTNSFSMIDTLNAKDKNNLFCGGFEGQRIEGINGDNLKIDSDKRQYFTDGNKIVLGIDGVCKEIKGVDAKTWQIVQDESIQGATSPNVIYSKDKNNAYFYNNKIEGGVDILSWKNIPEKYGYSIDKNNIYYQTGNLVGLDIKNYSFLNDYHYIVDKNNVFYESHKLKDIDVKSFQFVNSWIQRLDIDFNGLLKMTPVYNFSKDKNNVFYNGVKITGVDAESFISFQDNLNYGKDINHVFFCEKYCKVINGADAKSFDYKKIAENNYIVEDKYGTYINGELNFTLSDNIIQFLDKKFNEINQEEQKTWVDKIISKIDLLISKKNFSVNNRNILIAIENYLQDKIDY